MSALPLTAAIDALGTTGWTDHGIQDVDLTHIVGTAARPGDFDRRMRPLHAHLRHRWERVAEAMDAGRALPPVELVRLGELYFVRDGHHRVSVARVRGAAQIEATVTVGCTVAYACHCLTTTDLAHKAAERSLLRPAHDPEANASPVCDGLGWYRRVDHNRRGVRA